MARPKKDGLDYFPVDVHFDEKIGALRSVFKNDGTAFIVEFWQRAYRTNTGEVCLIGAMAESFSASCYFPVGKLSDIIRFSEEIKFIYQTKEGFYTSNGIQKRLDAVIKNREYDRNRKENELSVGKPVNLSANEMKLNEMKEKKSKKNTGKPSASRALFVKPSIQEIQSYCLERKNTVNANKFFDHYEARGWKYKGGQAMKDWRAAVRTWEGNNFSGDPLPLSEQRKHYKIIEKEIHQPGVDEMIDKMVSKMGV